MPKTKPIYELIETLKRRLDQPRHYRSKRNAIFSDLKDEYNALQFRDPQASRIAPQVNPSRTSVVFADMAVMGRGRQSALAEQMKLKLPPDYLEFCNVFKEYVLATRNPVHLQDAQGIEDICRGVRDGWDVPWSRKHRLFHFARIAGTPGYFVFRWKDGASAPAILLWEDYGCVGEADVLGADGDQLVTDQDFSGWLSRMIDTDGYPLMPGKDEPGLAPV